MKFLKKIRLFKSKAIMVFTTVLCLLFIVACSKSGDDISEPIVIEEEEEVEEPTIVIHEDLEYPLRSVFYYAWYPNNWDPYGYQVQYTPNLGYYDSNDLNAINRHITELEYANVDVAIASWWGLDNDNRKPRDYAIKKCMEETDRRTANGEIDLKWAIYYELEASYNESAEVIKGDLEYLMSRYVEKHNCYATINGKPVIFVYSRGSEDIGDEFTDKWAEAVDDKWHYILKIMGGYRDLEKQPSSWHQYGPSTRLHKVTNSSNKLVSYNLSPGFKHADPTKTTFLERADEELWTNLVTEMAESKVNWQLITSYNEWGEGTAIESAVDWKSDTEFGMYLDVLHDIQSK